MMQSDNSGQTEETLAPEETTPANALAEAGKPAPGDAPPDHSNRFSSANRSPSTKGSEKPTRSLADDRRSRNKRSSRSRSNKSGGSGSASDSSRGDDRSAVSGFRRNQCGAPPAWTMRHSA